MDFYLTPTYCPSTSPTLSECCIHSHVSFVPQSIVSSAGKQTICISLICVAISASDLVRPTEEHIANM